jgi:hypothetical protein
MQAAEPEPKRTKAAITADEPTHQKLADPYRNKIERREPHPQNTNYDPDLQCIHILLMYTF